MGRPKKEVQGTKEEMEDIVNDINDMVDEVEEKETVTKDDLFPTGSTLLNLAMSDTIYGGFQKGKICTMPGGSSSGKTLLVFTALASIAHNNKFDDYEIVFDDVESANEFNLPELFGQVTADRVKAPRYDKEGKGIFSNTIQEFKNNILKRVESNKPFVWVLDSLDALSSDEEVDKAYKEALKAAKSPEHVKELSGSYKTEKAKITGEILRMIKRGLKDTGSVLIMIQQTRANLNATMFGKKEITSGGNAPFFYSTHQVWTNKIKTHKDTDTKIILGQRVKADVTKNKLTGKKRSVEFDIYDFMGIDDVGSCVDYLVECGYWKKAGQTIKALELEAEMVRSKLIDYIEENNLENILQETTGIAWHEVEAKIIPQRKKRFE